MEIDWRTVSMEELHFGRVKSAYCVYQGASFWKSENPVGWPLGDFPFRSRFYSGVSFSLLVSRRKNVLSWELQKAFVIEMCFKSC